MEDRGENMRICENGIYRDMTQEEIEEYNKKQQEQTPQEPTLEEKVKLLEQENLKLKEELNITNQAVQDLIINTMEVI